MKKIMILGCLILVNCLSIDKSQYLQIQDKFPDFSKTNVYLNISGRFTNEDKRYEQIISNIFEKTVNVYGLQIVKSKEEKHEFEINLDFEFYPDVSRSLSPPTRGSTYRAIRAPMAYFLFSIKNSNLPNPFIKYKETIYAPYNKSDEKYSVLNPDNLAARMGLYFAIITVNLKQPNLDIEGKYENILENSILEIQKNDNLLYGKYTKIPDYTTYLVEDKEDFIFNSPSEAQTASEYIYGKRKYSYFDKYKIIRLKKFNNIILIEECVETTDKRIVALNRKFLFDYKLLRLTAP